MACSASYGLMSWQGLSSLHKRTRMQCFLYTLFNLLTEGVVLTLLAGLNTWYQDDLEA